MQQNWYLKGDVCSLYAISSTKQIYRYFLGRLFGHNNIDSANSVILGHGYLFIWPMADKGDHFKKSVKQGPICAHWVDMKTFLILTCFIESVLPICWIMHCTVLFFRVKENVRKSPVPLMFSTDFLFLQRVCENDLETIIILHYICCLMCSLGHLTISPEQFLSNEMFSWEHKYKKQTTFKNIDRQQAFLHSRALCVPRLSTITRVFSNLASRPCGYRSVHLQWLWQA